MIQEQQQRQPNNPNHNQSRARAIHMVKERRKMGIDDEEEKDAKVRIIQR